MIAATLAVGCSPSGSGERSAAATDVHLRCAAVIGAADRLMMTNAVPRDAELTQKGLVAAMTHVNIYAIPRRLDEKTAFATINQERDRILGAEPSAQVMQEAKACLN